MFDPVRGAGLALAVLLPFWLAFQWSLHSANALIVRPKELAVGWILSHNAVDPRTYFAPGSFQSVDLSTYGEAFVHTGYLRWTVIALAVVGVWRNPKFFGCLQALSRSSMPKGFFKILFIRVT